MGACFQVHSTPICGQSVFVKGKFLACFFRFFAAYFSYVICRRGFTYPFVTFSFFLSARSEFLPHHRGSNYTAAATWRAEGIKYQTARFPVLRSTKMEGSKNNTFSCVHHGEKTPTPPPPLCNKSWTEKVSHGERDRRRKKGKQ